MKGIKGFSLVELMVVLGILGVMVAVSAPNFIEWTRNARCKEAANFSLMTLRRAKGQAINLNQRVKVEFDLDARTVIMNVVGGPVISSSKVSDGIVIKGGTSCTTTTGKVAFTFNPMGSSSTGYVCIFEGPIKKYKIGIAAANTGRIRIDKF
jgi:prepilin-type N-terminal cleavage/methylation domain-containing protein